MSYFRSPTSVAAELNHKLSLGSSSPSESSLIFKTSSSCSWKHMYLVWPGCPAFMCTFTHHLSFPLLCYYLLAVFLQCGFVRQKKEKRINTGEPSWEQQNTICSRINPGGKKGKDWDKYMSIVLVWWEPERDDAVNSNGRQRVCCLPYHSSLQMKEKAAWNLKGGCVWKVIQ